MNKASVGGRINILFFVDYLAGVSQSKSLSFHTWIQRDIQKFVDLTVPPIMPGIANIAPTEKMVQSLSRKGLVEERYLGRLHEYLENRKASILANPRAMSELSKEEILLRMEEDRERSKKVKESLWSIESASDEFNTAWQTLGKLTDLDYEKMSEDNEIARDSKLGV